MHTALIVGVTVFGAIFLGLVVCAVGLLFFTDWSK